MARVRLIHWKAAAGTLLEVLRNAGYQVDYDEQLDPNVLRAIRQSPPDAFVIDLTRLPSHGREVAAFLRGRTSTRQVPILFVDGVAEKVAAIRKALPDAVYAPRARVRSALRETLTKRPANPVVPAQMMERYTARSTAQKLGIGEGTTVALCEPPRNYAAVLGELPAGARLAESPGEACPVTLWFVADAAACLATLPRARNLAAHTKLWIVWPKRGAGKESGITQQFLRESASAVGLVDYKICSVDRTWSAMLFARKKAV